MDTSCLYESTLSVGDKVQHVVAKTDGENLGNDLGDSVFEASWAVIRNFLGPILLWE